MRIRTAKHRFHANAQASGTSALATGHTIAAAGLPAGPNPSLEWTATGKPLGPPAGLVHHPSSGPSAFPASAPSAQTLGRTNSISASMRQASATPSPRMGVVAGTAVGVLSLAYASVLTAGLLTLPSPNHQIQDPWFTLMEGLIVVLSPAMVAFTVALHAWVPPGRKSIAVLSVVFMSMCAVVTCSVHFAVLFLSREPAFAAESWARLLFSFTWPSLAYALDILAWDVFFSLAALFAALCLRGTGLVGLVRGLLLASAGLAFFGVLGVPSANMHIRNIGILGYAVLFPIAATLSAVVFYRAGGQGAA